MPAIIGAKQGIEDCLASFGGEQVGLVVYGGSASILCPLSSDYDFVRYMLRSVRPRSVEFGGTYILSAIEKVVDQVLDVDRGGFQDVVVLTDGGDHAPNLNEVVERVSESGVNLLIAGLGNPYEGASIPLEDEEGNVRSLTFEGQVVYVRQQSDVLVALAEQSPGSEYVNLGTDPYHLGDIYWSYVDGKPTTAMDGETGHTVFKEGAFPLMLLALLFAVLAHPTYWKGVMRATVIVVALGLSGQHDLVAQQEEGFSFEAASSLYEQRQYEESSIAFDSLMREAESSQSIAILSFNRGLALLKQSEQIQAEAPHEALALALRARDAFLLAAREIPSFQRAKLRLSGLASIIVQLERAVEAEERQEQEQSNLLQALLDRTQALLEAQVVLREANIEADPVRSAKRGRNAPPIDVASIEPANASDLASSFAKRQAELMEVGRIILDDMRELDRILSTGEGSSASGVDTILDEPLVLIGHAVTAQVDAQNLLAVWQNWPTGRARQVAAEQHLLEILELFASDQLNEGEEDEWQDYEDYEMTDEGEGVPSSMGMEGEFRENAQMQELPVPNYSAEEIMMEEIGSQQFRQEQRAKANAGKVEKDW